MTLPAICDEKEVAKDYAAGMRQIDILKKHGIDTARLYKIKSKYKLAGRYNKKEEVIQTCPGEEKTCICGKCGQAFAPYEIEYQVFTHTCRECLIEYGGGLSE